MKEVYNKLLDQLIINSNLMQEIDGRNFLDFLKAHQVINLQEYDDIGKRGPTGSASVKNDAK